MKKKKKGKRDLFPSAEGETFPRSLTSAIPRYIPDCSQSKFKSRLYILGEVMGVAVCGCPWLEEGTRRPRYKVERRDESKGMQDRYLAQLSLTTANLYLQQL